MSDGRNSFKSAKNVLTLLDVIVAGGSLSISEVCEICGVEYAQARAYLLFLEDHYQLETQQKGLKKYWLWPLPKGSFI